MFFKALLALIFLNLSACYNVLPGSLLLSQNGDGQSRLIEKDPPVSFEPLQKPMRPVSMTVLKQLFADLKTAGRYLPEDAAYFSSIIVGETVRDIYPGSYDQERALRKLAPEGRAFVKGILRSCRVSPAKKIENGKPQPGQTVQMTISLSSDGESCGYLQKKSVQRTKAYSTVTGDPKTGAAQWSESHAVSFEDYRELRDVTMRDLSKILSLHFVNNIQGRVDYKASDKGFEINALLKGSGQAEVKFANNIVLRGPVNSETTTEKNKTTSKVRFLGTMDQGEILILVIRDDVSVLKVYVNGEPASSDVLDVFGLNLMEMASNRN